MVIFFSVLAVIVIMQLCRWLAEVERAEAENLRNQLAVLYYLRKNDIKITSIGNFVGASLSELLDNNEAVLDGYSVVLIDKFGMSYDRIEVKNYIKGKFWKNWRVKWN
mgnify:CR=1 FL=1